jgi:extradiol dioxygenase family protein
MRKEWNVFHLAIPSADLKKDADFYERLGCGVARSYKDRITIDFFGDQVVCHLSPEKIDQDPQMYPRHFGVTMSDLDEYEEFLKSVQEKELPFFAKPFIRFEGKPEEHRSFMLLDPSNNILEFKFYRNSEMMI